MQLLRKFSCVVIPLILIFFSTCSEFFLVLRGQSQDLSTDQSDKTLGQFLLLMENK